MADYQVRLDIFEGPMDLLVFLIRKNEIDIYDIPIALIADQYMQYITAAGIQDLEQAGDFLLLAATLLQIKSRMLLPRPQGEDEEFEDPRTELVEKIVEYLQFKEIAEHMRRLEELSQRRSERGLNEVELLTAQEGQDSEGPQIEATISDLMLAFGRFLNRKPEAPPPVHRVVREKISTAQRVLLIRNLLLKKRRVLLSDLVPDGSSRMMLVVTIVALLEMAKQGEIRVEQADNFGNLWVARGRKRRTEENESGAPEPRDGFASDNGGVTAVEETAQESPLDGDSRTGESDSDG